MPHWCYQDPALIGESRPLSLARSPSHSADVSRETLIAVHTPARDPYYTQARRLHIQSLMKGR